MVIAETEEIILNVGDKQMQASRRAALPAIYPGSPDCFCGRSLPVMFLLWLCVVAKENLVGCTGCLPMSVLLAGDRILVRGPFDVGLVLWINNNRYRIKTTAISGFGVSNPHSQFELPNPRPFPIQELKKMEELG